MFCKHCGGDLAFGDVKCKRCGKDVAAKSNCGGFYDLVQEEKPVQPVMMAAPQKSKNPVALIVAVAAGFALLLVIIGVMLVKQSQLSEELEIVKNELQDVICQQEETEATEETTEETTGDEEQTESTEELNVTLPDLFGQDDETEETEAPAV